MWTSLNALTQQAAQMAASAVKEAGLDATLVRQGGARGFVCMGLSLAAPCGTWDTSACPQHSIDARSAHEDSLPCLCCVCGLNPDRIKRESNWAASSTTWPPQCSPSSPPQQSRLSSR